MKRLTIIGIALGVVFLGSFGIAMALGVFTDASVTAQLDALQQSPYAGVLIALLVIGLLAGDIVLPIPATITMIIAGNMLGTWWGGLASSVGLMGAAAAGYFACRFGREHVFRKLVTEDEAAKAQRWFDDYGLPALVITRGLPVVPEVVTCLAGLARVSAGRFIVYSAIAAVPYAFLHSWAGASSRATYPWPALVVLIGVPALAWAVWRVKGRNAAKAAEDV